MTETDPVPSSSEPLRPKRNRFIRTLLSILLLIALFFAAILYYCPRQGVIGVPLAQKSSELDVLNRRMDAIETQIKALDERVLSIQPAADTSALNEEIKKLKEQIDSKESERMAQKYVAAAFAFRDLRDEATAGRPFSPQLTTLLATSADDPKIAELAAPLGPYASSGAPTVPQLQETLVEEEKSAAVPPTGETASLIERIKAVLQPLVSIRALHDPRFADVEKALDAHNAAQALEAAKALPDPARKGLEPWQSKLEARVNIDATLKALDEHFASPLTQRAAP